MVNRVAALGSLLSSRWRRYARENGPRAALATERIRELERERDESLLVRYESRICRFPLEARYQAELADAYLALGRFDEALRGYQAARRSPAFNLRAGVGAARSLAGKGLADLPSGSSSAASPWHRDAPTAPGWRFSMICTCSMRPRAAGRSRCNSSRRSMR